MSVPSPPKQIIKSTDGRCSIFSKIIKSNYKASGKGRRAICTSSLKSKNLSGNLTRS